MAQYIHIFARSDQYIDATEIAKFMATAWYGDGNITADHDGQSDWRKIVFNQVSWKRPIMLYRNTDPTEVARFCDEELTERDPPEALAQQLRSVRQVLSFEISPDFLDDDTWEMLDITEAFLARTLDGFILAVDGVYDASLGLLAD